MTARLTSFALAAMLALAPAAADAAPLSLRFIGQQLIPSAQLYQGTRIGGLSGIDYDAATGRYFAISDDRSDFSPARFYTFDLALTPAAFTGVSPTSVTTLRQPGGLPYPQTQIDPESIRLTPTGTLVYTSEGDQTPGQQSPFVREMRLDGSYIRDFAIPAKYQPTATGVTGIRDNLAFESLTYSIDGTKLYTATENALAQDGPAATTANGSNSRILRFDAASGVADGEFVYQTDPVVAAAIPAGQFVTAGLVELLAISSTDFLAIERSFSVGVGNAVKIYQFSLAGATNVLSFDSLTGQAFTPVTKTLVLDLATLGLNLDNIEGVTFGQTLSNGNRSLILVSDNNFTDTQPSQFLAFEIGSAVPEPASWAMLIAGFGMIGGTMRRRAKIVIA